MLELKVERCCDIKEIYKYLNDMWIRFMKESDVEEELCLMDSDYMD